MAILDLGCGHGALLYALQKAGYHNAYGVDNSPEQLAVAQELGVEGVVEDDVMGFLTKTPNAILDVVVAFDLVEHFTKTELVHLVDEIWRVCKPDGKLILHTPNAEGPFAGRMRYWDFTHELAFTSTSLGQLLRASGFRTVTYWEDKPVVHGFKSLVRAGLWSLIRAGLLFYIAVETGVFDRHAVFSQNLLAIAIKA